MSTKPSSAALGPERLLGEADFVRALARSLVSDPSAADDVAQAALVAGLERPPRSPAALRGWLARVVRNFARARGRGERRRSTREESAARSERLPSVAEVLEREAARASVVRAVLALEEPYRAAILLRFYESQPPRAIAARVGVPVETVHTRTKRALEKLRVRLDREFGSRSAWASLLLPFTRPPLTPAGEGASSPSEVPKETSMHPTLMKLAGTAVALAAGLVYWARVEGASPPPSHANEFTASMTPVVESTARPPAPSGRSAATPSSPARPPATPPEVFPPSATAHSTTGTLSLTITWFDGTPAADLEARVTDVGRNALEPLAARTDAAGRCTIEGLRPGRAWVTLSRMDFQRTVEIVAGTSSELALQLARGWDVEGVVVDAQGNPVAGATVWLGDLAASIDSSYAAATTAPDGSFGLRSCVDYAALWARAPGHAPSLLRLIKETRNQPEGSVVGVTLALGGAGATITGEVRDPSGAPVEGALVLVDGQDMLHAFWHTLPGGEQITLSRPGPTAVRTDASGTFTVAGVHPGTVPLGVLVPGLAPWRDSVEVAPGASAAATITLSSGFRLTGVVRDAAGNPTAARVLALLSSIQISPTVLTGPDGAFEFEGLPPGEVRITTDNGEGTAWTTLTGSAGDELTWDAFLVPEGPAEPWSERERWR